MSKTPVQEQAVGAGKFEYCPAPGVFDEMQERQAKPRAHWQELMESFQQLGVHELQSRWESGRRILREHGVSYNHYGDPAGTDRPWGLDLIPLIITGAEWAALEAGLIQRSRLFNLILADIYAGPQRLLRDGFIPPELVYENPGFLRACRGTRITSQVYLHLHACDLGRSPDGQWWVLSDRAQAPSGSGYAWENRTVIARILPDQIHQGRVQRLAGFFQRQREMLFNLAPPRVSHPSLVLLTPGPANQTYFEDTYLARHLGLPLVEGADLTVRDRRVFLKTIEGLQPVHIILRRVDDSFCDPLELRGDSLLGVSGLVEATRAGNVTVANALGAGLMESPVFLAFLPVLCRQLLGEELLLPSIATWWCGQAQELKYVQEHLPGLILKPAFSRQTPLPLPVADAPAANKASDRRKSQVRMLQANPRDFVAQEFVKLSRAPSWAEDHLVARPIVLRTFVATDGKNFTVMPGGLTRVANHPHDFLIAVTSGQSSKDTWVISDRPNPAPEQALIPSEARVTEAGLMGVASRAADHLFWLGRYTERLEQLLRVVRCVLGRLSGEFGPEAVKERAVLAELSMSLGLLPAAAPAAANGELAQQMLHLLYDTEFEGGVRALLRQIRSIAAAVRDRLSGDTWRILGRLETDSRARPSQLPLTAATTLSHNLVLDLAAFSGMEMENMTRGRGWRFLDVGRRLERGLSVITLVRSAIAIASQPTLVLEPVLEIADSVMTYRRQHFDAPRLPGVMALLLHDASNPRSLAFQVNVIAEHASALLADLKPASAGAEKTRMHSLAESLRSSDVNALAALVAQSTPQPLLDRLDEWSAELSAVSDQVTNRYFSHTFPRPS